MADVTPAPETAQESQHEQDVATLMRASHFLREHGLMQIAWEVDAVRLRLGSKAAAVIPSGSQASSEGGSDA